MRGVGKSIDPTYGIAYYLKDKPGLEKVRAAALATSRDVPEEKIDKIWKYYSNAGKPGLWPAFIGYVGRGWQGRVENCCCLFIYAYAPWHTLG